MDKQDNGYSEASSLREKAEEQLIQEQLKRDIPNNTINLSDSFETDTLKLIHELEVHQIELEIQNKQLQTEIEKTASATLLYDIAPAGYFTLKRDGTICQLNLRGSRMLGKERASLLNSNFRFFVSQDTLAVFNDFRNKIFETSFIQTCEVRLLIDEEKSISVLIEGIIVEEEQKYFLTVVDITERKEAEEKLLESEKKLQKLLHHLNAGVVVHAPDTHIIYANEKASELLGLTIDQMMEKTAIDPAWCFIYEDGTHVPVEEYPVSSVFSKRSPIQNMILGIVRPKTNDQVWVEINAYPEFEPDGQISQLVVTFIDITEHKKAQEKLKEGENKFRNLFENSPVGKSMTGIDGSLYINKSFCKIVGYSEEELAAMKWIDISHPDDIQQIDEIVQSLLNGDISQARFEKRYIHKNGNIIWADVTTYLQRDKENKPQFFITSIVDITERKLAIDSLAASEKEFRLLTEAMPQIVWITRADGWNIYFNQQWVDYTGLTLEESYGHGWTIPFHPDDQQRAWDAWQNAVTNNAIYSIECRIRRYDGIYRWWLIRGIPILGEKGEILKWFGTCTDIEQIKESEKALIESQNRLQLSLKINRASVFEDNFKTGTVVTTPELYKFLGYEYNEIPKTIEELTSLINPEDIPRVMDALSDHINGKTSEYYAEFRMRKKSGDWNWVDGKGKVTEKNDKGEPLLLLGISRDINDRKLVEEELLKSEAFMRTAVENLPIIFYLIDQDGKFKLSIGAGLKGLGLEPNQVVGLSAYEIYKEFPEIINSIKKSIAGEQSYFETTVTGSTYNNYLAPVFDEKGLPSEIVGVALDVTLSKQAEEKIKQFNIDLENQVRQRTAELNETVAELEEQTRVFVGRELRMIELKEQIADLEMKLSEKDKNS